MDHYGLSDQAVKTAMELGIFTTIAAELTNQHSADWGSSPPARLNLAALWENQYTEVIERALGVEGT